MQQLVVELQVVLVLSVLMAHQVAQDVVAGMEEKEMVLGPEVLAELVETEALELPLKLAVPEVLVEMEELLDY